MTDDDADSQQLGDATLRLREELLNLDVAVRGIRAGDAPPGAKAVDLAALGTLIITLGQSTVLAAVVKAVSDWLTQRRQGSIRLELGGDVLELSGRPAPGQLRLADAWVRRHGPGEPEFTVSRHALIVANYDYQDPGLQRLRAPARDAEQLARVLRDPQIGGFDVDIVLNESAAVINEAVEAFFADRSPDELLLLHFSGHGVKDEAGELHFATATTKLNRLGATAVAADFVNRRMNRSRSRRIVLLLDCCYAGAFGRGMVARAGPGIGIEEQFGGRGRAVITASSAMEYAFEGQDLADTRQGGASVFTGALIEGLDTGDADRDQDGYIGLDELYEYVYEQVRRITPNQTPGKWTFDLQGDFHIARRSRPVMTAAALPPELQEAMDHPLAGIRAGAVAELSRLLKSRNKGIALAASLALRHLADDDSRTVAAAATAALGPADTAVPPPQAAVTEPRQIRRPAQQPPEPAGWTRANPPAGTTPSAQQRPTLPAGRSTASPQICRPGVLAAVGLVAGAGLGAIMGGIVGNHDAAQGGGGVDGGTIVVWIVVCAIVGIIIGATIGPFICRSVHSRARNRRTP